jgi:hypothetical protein
MSRRIAQTILRTLRTPHFQSLPITVPRQLPRKARYQLLPIFSVRHYATQGPRGVPIKEEEYREQTLTPEQKERASLYEQAR